MILIPILLFSMFLYGCSSPTGTVNTVKPLTPTEVQVITQVVSKRLILPKVNPSQREHILQGLTAAMVTLQTVAPQAVMSQLGSFLGEENKDISDLIVTLLAERVDLSLVTEMEGKAYVWAILAGVEGGLQ